MIILPHMEKWCWMASKLCFVSYAWVACWNQEWL